MSKSGDSDINISEIKDSCVGLYKKVSEKRFKRLSNGYAMDRWIFQLAMFLTFGWLLFVANSYHYDLDYYECGTGSPDYATVEPCKNPFYKPATWKNQEFLPPGEYGQKPGPLFNSVTYVPVILFLIGGFLNHLIHNYKRRDKT